MPQNPVTDEITINLGYLLGFIDKTKLGLYNNVVINYYKVKRKQL